MKYCEGHKNRKIKMSPSKDYPRKLYVLETAKVPSCLVECEFISNQEQEKWLGSEEGQKQAAHAIAQGIKSFIFSLPNSKEVAEPEDELKNFIEDNFNIDIEEPIESVDTGEDVTTDIHNTKEDLC